MNRGDGFGAGSQGLRMKQAQLELESDQQGREKVLGEENIGHNLLKKMGAFFLFFSCWRVLFVWICFGVPVSG